MITVVVLIVVIVALVLGTMMTLRSSARTGMPSQDVLERAKRRARQLESSEKGDDARDD